MSWKSGTSVDLIPGRHISVLPKPLYLKHVCLINGSGTVAQWLLEGCDSELRKDEAHGSAAEGFFCKTALVVGVLVLSMCVSFAMFNVHGSHRKYDIPSIILRDALQA